MTPKSKIISRDLLAIADNPTLLLTHQDDFDILLYLDYALVS